MSETTYCIVCRRHLPVSEFRKRDPRQGKGAYAPTCRGCHNKYTRGGNVLIRLRRNRKLLEDLRKNLRKGI